MVLGLSLFAIACGGDDDDEGGTPATSEDVEMTQGTDLTIAMVTHGDGGSFWSVAKKGAEDGAKAMGVELKYSRVQQRPRGAGAADRGRGHREASTASPSRRRTRTRSRAPCRARSTPASRSSR